MRRAIRSLLRSSALLLPLAAGACQSAERHERANPVVAPRPATPPRPVDERLMLALEEARAWQHRADTHLDDGQRAAAIADVQATLNVRFPALAPEAEEVRLDAWARLATLHLDARAAAAGDDGGAPVDGGEEAEARALADVESGRREATRDSFFRAHLETVAGEIAEARARRLERATPPRSDEARAARKEALAAYARSIEINRRVQATLGEEAP